MLGKPKFVSALTARKIVFCVNQPKVLKPNVTYFRGIEATLENEIPKRWRRAHNSAQGAAQRNPGKP